MTPLVTAPNSLLGLDPETQMPVDTRVLNGDSLRQLVNVMIIEDQGRNKNRAMVKGMVDGNPPFSDAKRLANKLQWTANLNFMQGKAMMDSTAIPYYAIFNGVENYAEWCTSYQPDNPDHQWWNERMSLRFDQMLRRWDQFDFHIQQISFWMRLHGIGPVIFDNDADWRFRSLDTGAVLAPQGSASCVDQRMPYLAVRIPYRIHELFVKIQDEDAARAAGWNIANVKNAIRYAAKGMSPNGQWWNAPWEEFQRRIKNNDLWVSYTASDLVYCDHVYVREPDGKISHFIITEAMVARSDGGAVPIDDDSEDNGFLLRRLKQYDSMDEALQLFFLDTYDGTYHSVRGYGTTAFKYFALSDRLMCRAADGAFIKSSLVLQPGTQRNSDKLQLTQHGPVTWLPAGAEMKQIQMAGALEELLTLHRVLTNQFAAGMGVSIGQPLSRSDGRGEVPTAEQIRQQATNDSTISGGQMTLFFMQLDRLYDQVARRVLKSDDEEAKRFKRECREDGVPDAALRDIDYVRANRTSGYGSPTMRKQSDGELLQIIGMLPEEGRQHALEDIVVSIKGSDKLHRYVPRKRVAGNDEWEASVENDQIEDGREPVLASGQNDVIHLQSHMQDAANKLAPAQEAFDAGQKLPPDQIQALASYCAIMDKHCQAHLSRLSLDPTRKNLVKMFQDQLSQLQSFNGKLRAQYIKSVKAAQLAAEQDRQATALNALDEARLQQTQVDNQLKAMKTSASIRTSNAKSVNSIRMNQIKTAADLQLKAAKTQQDMRLAEQTAESATE